MYAGRSCCLAYVSIVYEKNAFSLYKTSLTKLQLSRMNKYVRWTGWREDGKKYNEQKF